ncbi:hypothetical protein VdG1_03328 [Verticillium dahliae VDG1]|nr:hypothetical protein VdG1_03328 [Verticillium dahliae VDG1]
MASRCSCTALTKLPIGRSTSQSLTSRSFSTTTSQQRGLPRISPESPDWIQIPRARQDRASESKPDHLAAEVDKLFGDDYFKKQASSTSTDADNAWDVWGAPPTLQHLGHLATKDATEHTSRTAKRQKSIAEELTGGQMD